MHRLEIHIDAYFEDRKDAQQMLNTILNNGGMDKADKIDYMNGSITCDDEEE